MTFKTVYDKVILKWGDSIKFNDGKTQPGNGFLSQDFSKQWAQVEQEVGTDNNWDNLMVWTMYQVFHKIAKTNFEKGLFEFNPSDIDPAIIEEKYFENLNDEYYAQELSEYKR